MLIKISDIVSKSEDTEAAKKAKTRNKENIKTKMERLRDQKANYMKSYDRKMEQLKKSMERLNN